jgi:ketosteroid isomerase-like protein
VTLDEWIEGYRRSWEEGDGEALLRLFIEDAVYRSHPFREPHVGHAGIHAYWRRATDTQGEVRVVMGRPFVDGPRVAVEWWTTMVDEGEEITLPGCLLLRFADDGRCVELREYWHVEPGRKEPHSGWGE